MPIAITDTTVDPEMEGFGVMADQPGNVGQIANPFGNVVPLTDASTTPCCDDIRPRSRSIQSETTDLTGSGFERQYQQAPGKWCNSSSWHFAK